MIAIFRILAGACVGLFCLVFSASAGQPQPAAERLALKGYDPVAYFTMGRPVQGKPEYEYAVDGVRYHFATAEHLEMFRKDPDRYAPQYQGLCAMGLAAKGYKVEANPENWVIHEGRLYVTQRDFGPPAFKTDPKRWVASANVNVEELKELPLGSALAWW